MDKIENKPTDNQLPLEGQTQPPAGDQAQPSSPAAAEKAAAEKAAAEKAAAEKAAAEKAAAEKARKAGSRTAAKAPKKSPSARAGARPRRLKADPRPELAPANVHLVMLTSRVSDVDGRFVARRRIALATDDRAGELVLRGMARKATPDEIKAAGDALPKIR